MPATPDGHHLQVRQPLAGQRDKTAKAAKGGTFEKYKTSQNFDGTVHHPEWLG